MAYHERTYHDGMGRPVWATTRAEARTLAAAEDLHETIDALAALACGDGDPRTAHALLGQLVRDAGRFGDSVAASVVPMLGVDR